MKTLQKRVLLSLALHHIEQLQIVAKDLDCLDGSLLEEIQIKLLREQTEEYNK